MKSFLGESWVFFTGFLLICVLVHVGEAMAEDWKFFTSDSKFDYYFDGTSKIHAGKDIVAIKVKAVCIDKEKYLNNIKIFGKPVEKYEKYSHDIISARVDCSNKRCLVELITEYDNQGKVIDYVAGALTNWLPVSKGTLYEILYQAACHRDAS